MAKRSRFETSVTMPKGPTHDKCSVGRKADSLNHPSSESQPQRPGDIQAYVTQFVHHIGQLLERKAHEDSKQIEVYPFAFIDASTDSVHPTKASVDLIGSPKDSRYQMKWEDVKALCPIACRDTKKADGINMHRDIFICCDNDDPHNEGLLLINVDWDENVDRSDEELEAVGK